MEDKKDKEEGEGNRRRKRRSGKKHDLIGASSNSIFASIMSFWQQQYSPTTWSDMYNEYMKYATRIAQIYNEYTKRVQIMSELYKELAENSERINELQRESIQITEEMSKNWFAKYYFFGKRIERPLSSAAVKEEQAEVQKESK